MCSLSPPIDRDMYAPSKLLSSNICTSLDALRTYQDNHWCLIAQIANYTLSNDNIVLFLQIGSEIVEAYSTQDLVQNVNSFSNLAIGNTIVIMYANVQEGRIPLNLDEMFIFNTNIKSLIQDMISLKSRVCFSNECDSTKVFACNNCKVALYCGKDHQRHEWKVHKKICSEMSILKEIVLLFSKKSPVFKRHSFKPQTQELSINKDEFKWEEKCLDIQQQAKVVCEMLDINDKNTIEIGIEEEGYEIVDLEKEQADDHYLQCKGSNTNILTELNARLIQGKSDAVIEYTPSDDILAFLPLISPKETRLFWLINVTHPLLYKEKYEALGWEIPDDCNEELLYCKKENTAVVLTCVVGINPTFVGSEMIIRVLQTDQLGNFELKQALYDGKHGMCTIWLKSGNFGGYDDNMPQFYQNLIN
ncbi:hypothetical protein HDV01_003472 [Terramyces sp. JEL0728]|nr:hypothetical protein HDV01_003472 [Terramyces sp. JEL0728]